MTFTHALATNNYGPAKFIVSSNIYEGTHTTIASALSSASSGDTIFIRPGTYSENLTLKAGVNLTAYPCDSINNVIISGKSTFTTAGTVSISGVTLQTNSDFAIAVTGTLASIIKLINCNINCTNNTGISFTSSSASAEINISKCVGNLGTTGIAFFASTSAGTIILNFSSITNLGLSTTASTITSGAILIDHVNFSFPITASSTGTVTLTNSVNDCGGINTTAFTLGGSGTFIFANNRIVGGTASAMSIGGTLTISCCDISSTNTNAITGAGTINYNGISFSNTSSTINTTTQTPRVFRTGHSRSTLQPAFFAYLGTADLNVTGAGTTYRLGSGNALTEVFDQNGDFNTNGTFTAPLTGRYFLQYTQAIGDLTAAMTQGSVNIITSNNSLSCINFGYGAARNANNTVTMTGCVFCDMDAADTATFTSTVSNGVGDTADSLVTTGGTQRTFVSGYLVC